VKFHYDHPKAVAMRRNLKQYEASVGRYKQLAWELFSHPDATPEQLADLRERAVALAKSHREMMDSARESGLI
jgi:hypothetical protein